MFGIRYFKADSSTYVIKTSGGKILDRGNGLNFFYNAAMSSIAAIPMNVQESPFIFSLQTADFQEVSVQGQIAYRILEPEVIAALLNFTVKQNCRAYVSEDPLKLNDQVTRMVQSIIQAKIQASTLRESLGLNQSLAADIKTKLAEGASLGALGIGVVNVTIAAISPSPETSRALEAEAREAILKEADDAIYARRKSAVEQERTIKEAELKTEFIVQQKQQEIEEARIANERAILRGANETERERLAAEIEAERRRGKLVELKTGNGKQEADLEAYGIIARMRAFTELPVENLKALTLANMDPEQLMALAIESLAQNAGKIGEVNIGPEMFGRMLNKAVRK